MEEYAGDMHVKSMLVCYNNFRKKLMIIMFIVI